MTALFDPLVRPAGFAPRRTPSHVHVRRPAPAPVGRGGQPVRRHVQHPVQSFHPRPVRLSEAVYRRRRRMVSLVLALLASFGSFALLGGGAFASNPDSGSARVPRTFVVSEGDTLWDIARAIKPTGSIGDLVSELVRLNGAHLEVGQVVRIP